MNIKEIKQLVKLMVDGDLSELDITDGETQVHLKRGYGEQPVLVQPAQMAPAQPAAPAAPAPQPAEAPAEAEARPAENLLDIKSPMVGTFYSSPDPESEPYVSVGSSVDENTVVGIVEAMKVMNEIKAECRGTVTEVCLKNAQPVEFGQVLFRVKPD